MRQENILKLDLPQSDLPSGKMVLDMQNVTLSYPDQVADPIISGFSFSIFGPGRVAILGANGSGKTTLLKLLTGALAPSLGKVLLGTDKVAYLPQSTFMLEPHETVLVNFQRLSRVNRDGAARELLSRFLFFKDDVYKEVSALSGGERIRLALGGVLSREDQVQILIIDEPTNHLDMNSIEQLESALQQYHGALIVVSHDIAFLDAIGIEREIWLGDIPRSSFR
jgi:ATPase subunit of ABC transporter with duplicated ATPase domains